MGLLLAKVVHFPQWPPFASYQRTDPPLVARRASLLQDQSPMHLQSPRTLESVAVMHMCLVMNSFRSRASSDSDRSVKSEPIGGNNIVKVLMRKRLRRTQKRSSFLRSIPQVKRGAISLSSAPFWLELDKYVSTQIRPSN